MPLRKTREQREAKRAEMDRLDREASARQVALTDAARSRPPLFCQACDAALAPSAVRCDHCGSDDLALTMPPCPLFSEAVPDGICWRCQGTSFHKPTSAGAFAASGMRYLGPVGAAVGAAIGAVRPSVFVFCDDCGARFGRG
jgi:hypothetical protein